MCQRSTLAVLDDALILAIERAYFSLTGGFERWLYRIVRKIGGRQRRGWRFEFGHLYLKSGSLSPFRRFAFESRDIDPFDVAPDHWRHVHNRLAARHEPRTYTRARHYAWLKRRRAGP
jgi:plasmid replication initiation protein